MSSSKTRLLIVDDDESIRSQMKWALAKEYEVFLAEDRKNALEGLRKENPAVVCLDLGLPPHPASVEEGFLTLGQMLESDPHVKIIVITGQGEKEHALKAIEQGAYDFFSKPIEIDVLKVVLERASYLREIECENLKLREGFRQDSFGEMLGTSEVMQQVFASIKKVATSGAPVLVTGETGTGKELTARAIHRLSRRKEGPFVPINCGAIPENLLESELFGHEKGSFTGAHVQRLGQFESAQDGTLFLDEVGELPLALQVKLLRFLQDGQIQRVGGRQAITVDARIIAATNIKLEQAIEQRQFREDLYYRLAVVIIELPPLRERNEDLLLLSKAFLDRYSEESRKKVTGFTGEALRAVEEYTWPGNIRELENRVRRAVIMAEGSRVSVPDLGLDSTYSRFANWSLRDAREAVEKELIERALIRCRGNISRAAEELDVSRPTLYELIEKLGVER